MKNTDNQKFSGEGFTVVTVLCAIIECFAAFRIGRIHRHDKRNGEPNYYYKNESNSIFVEFILNEKVKIFKDNFYQIGQNGIKTDNTPFNANDFYSDVRCGLMHEARTKKNWTINAYPNKTGAESEKVFLERDNNKIKIYRTVLYYRLKEYLNSYFSELRQENSESEGLRRLFARKLDHLFEVAPDPSNFEWWNDQ